MEFLKRTKTPEQLIWIGLGIWWVANLIQAGCTELANDEAYYHMFSLDLAWGYFDHPPMTAFLVWLGRFLGEELGVRFFFTVLQPLYVYVFWRVIRPTDATVQDAGLFLLITAAMPILQLYGFIAVPDGPLMLFTALFLWAYKRFTEKNDWLSVVLVGLTIAALAYSKYHGALIVLLTIASNVKLLKNPKTYVAAALAVLIMVPHFCWQANNDWVSFRYHLSGRNRDFQWNFVSEYILNLFAIFNPLLFPVFLAAWWKTKAQTPVIRAMSCIAAGFILFFLASTLRGYVQPQWEIPAIFGIITYLFLYARKREKLCRYTVWVGWITIVLIALVRLEMIFNPLHLKFEVFDNKVTYSQLKEVAGDRPILFRDSYTAPAKYHFYTGGQGFTNPSIYYRTSQYELKTDDRILAGKPAVIEIHDTLKIGQRIELANGRAFRYLETEAYIPVREIRIESDPLPEQMRIGENFTWNINLTNPYPYDYIFDGKSTRLLLAWRRGGEKTRVFEPEYDPFILPANGTVTIPATFTLPEIKAKTYRVGFTVSNSPGSTWFNGAVTQISVIK